MYKLNILLASSRSKTMGIGHFSRMLALCNSLTQSEDFNPYFSILGDNVPAKASKNIEMNVVSALTSEYFYLVRDFIEVNHVKVFIMDSISIFLYNLKISLLFFFRILLFIL